MSSLAPKHRLLFELGRGGMGTVFLAVHEGPAGFSKLKVVKRLRADLAADAEFLEMFLDEARLSARLSHPNVVQTNEVGFDGSHYFLELEYLEGQTLDALMRAAREGRDVATEHVVWVIAQTLAGLHYAHELTDRAGAPLHVVHRDVSPQNVMVTYDGAVKVLDFRIAKTAESGALTRTGVVKGKVNYMAPEQALRRAVDRRADVFACGVMLWQALTRRRLWHEMSEGEIFVWLDRGDIPSARSVDPEVCAELDAICARALAREPSDRFATAEAMQHALEDWLEKGTRTSARAVAATMRALFGDRRAEMKQRIDTCLRSEGEDAGAPVLSAASDTTKPSSTKRAIGPATISATRDVRGAASDPPALTPSPRESTPPNGPSKLARRAAAAFVALGLAIAALVIARGDRAVAMTALAAPVRIECAQKECTARGGVCRSGACVPLASDDCSVLAEPGDVANPDTIWLGAMFPLSGADASAFVRANANAADLARRDFATMSGGLPSARGPRPVGLVMCDDAVDPARAARHLVDAIGVPAVIGFHRSKEVVDLASSLFVPKEVVAFAALNASPLVTRVAHPDGSPRFVWRTTVSSSDWVVPVARVVEEVYERELRASVLGANDRVRVALVRMTNSATLSSADALFSALRFNGRDAIANGDDYRQIVFDDAMGEASESYARAVDEIVRFRPHVIVYMDPEVFPAHLLAPLEAAWPARERFRPRYVTGGAPTAEPLARFVGASAERRKRFLGVDVPASTATNVRLAMRYNEVFSPKVTAATAPGVAYDAFYTAAYAMFASGEDRPSGAGIARGIARLVPPGVRIDVGPTHVFDAFEALRAGKNIDLDGATTTLDFDLATGESRASFAVYCIEPSTDGRADAIESGLVFRSGAPHLEGTLRCP